MKLRMIGIMGTVVGALLVTSLPALGADGVQTSVVTRLSAGTARESFKWVGMDTPSISGDAGDGRYFDYTSDDATLRLTLQAHRRTGTTKGCAAVAWVTQWDRSQGEWVILVQRRLSTTSRTTRKAAATASGWDFRFDGEPTYVGVATNGYCSGVSATLSSSQPWTYGYF